MNESLGKLIIAEIIRGFYQMKCILYDILFSLLQYTNFINEFIMKIKINSIIIVIEN